MEAPHPDKVEMPSIEPFDVTADPNNHLHVYVVHTYVQDMEDAMCY